MKLRYILSARNIRDDQDLVIFNSYDLDEVIAKMKKEILENDPEADYQYIIGKDWSPVDEGKNIV